MKNYNGWIWLLSIISRIDGAQSFRDMLKIVIEIKVNGSENIITNKTNEVKTLEQNKNHKIKL